MWIIDHNGNAHTEDHCGRRVVVKQVDTPDGQLWRIIVQVKTGMFPSMYPTQDEAMAVVERWLAPWRQ